MSYKTFELTNQEIRELALTSPNADRVLRKKFPKAFAPMVSQGISGFKVNGIEAIEIRVSGSYKDSAFWLSDKFNWEIVNDSLGVPCLIPTPKS